MSPLPALFGQNNSEGVNQKYHRTADQCEPSILLHRSRLGRCGRQFLETLFQGFSQAIDCGGWIAAEKGIGI